MSIYIGRCSKENNKDKSSNINGSTAENTFVIILTNHIPLILLGYEPRALTTVNITMASTTTAPTTYISKYSTITLLNRTNYAT